jgi:hypothetical protein
LVVRQPTDQVAAFARMRYGSPDFEVGTGNPVLSTKWEQPGSKRFKLFPFSLSTAYLLFPDNSFLPG